MVWQSSNRLYRSNSEFKVTGTGFLRCAGNITAYYSDERLKDVIEYIDPNQALINVCKWKKVKYTANKLASELAGYNTSKVEIGLLAGEISADYPEITPIAPFDATDTVDDNGVCSSKSGENYKTLDYERIVAIQAAAIEALNNKLEAQQLQIDMILKGS